jgi:hypothetical protein
MEDKNTVILALNSNGYHRIAASSVFSTGEGYENYKYNNVLKYH